VTLNPSAVSAGIQNSEEEGVWVQRPLLRSLGKKLPGDHQAEVEVPLLPVGSERLRSESSQRRTRHAETFQRFSSDRAEESFQPLPMRGRPQGFGLKEAGTTRGRGVRDQLAILPSCRWLRSDVLSEPDAISDDSSTVPEQRSAIRFRESEDGVRRLRAGASAAALARKEVLEPWRSD